MKLSKVKDLLECEVLCGAEKLDEIEVSSCLGSDMMSDVLAYAEPWALLITGLTNAQSLRTANVADAAAVIYIRGKRPNETTLELAQEMGMPVLTTEKGMFEVCGLLYGEGLAGIC
jgi:predicted transcriptional regulator